MEIGRCKERSGANTVYAQRSPAYTQLLHSALYHPIRLRAVPLPRVKTIKLQCELDEYGQDREDGGGLGIGDVNRHTPQFGRRRRLAVRRPISSQSVRNRSMIDAQTRRPPHPRYGVVSGCGQPTRFGPLRPERVTVGGISCDAPEITRSPFATTRHGLDSWLAVPSCAVLALM